MDGFEEGGKHRLLEGEVEDGCGWSRSSFAGGAGMVSSLLWRSKRAKNCLCVQQGAVWWYCQCGAGVVAGQDLDPLPHASGVVVVVVEVVLDALLVAALGFPDSFPPIFL